jgi:hypothetical protein
MKVIDESDLLDLGYYSYENISRKKYKNIFEIIILVLIWYSTAVITITTSKEIMNRVQFPFLLCCIQFIFASSLSYSYLRYSGQYKTVSPSISSTIYQISLSYTLGFVLTNWAFSIGKRFSLFLALFPVFLSL